MLDITRLLTEPLVDALGWTIIHSLWQGALFAIVLGVLLVLMHRYSSTSRYFISVIVMGLYFISIAATFSLFYEPAPQPELSSFIIEQAEPSALSIETEEQAAPEMPSVAATAQVDKEMVDISVEEESTITLSLKGILEYFQQHFPLVVTLYLMGVLVLLLRFLGSLAYIQRLKSYRTKLLPDYWLEKAEALKLEMGIRQNVSFLTSKYVITPMAIGVLKPAVLITSKILTDLSEKQIEAILIHELAHIKRNDYAVNLIQSLSEILFFYHPAVWWMSSTIRNERENCCDDIAINMTGDTYDYASALVQLHESRVKERGSVPDLAMALLGPKYSFKNRIKRMFDNPNTFADFREGFVTALILILGFVAISFNAWGSKNFLEEKSQKLSNKIEQIFSNEKDDLTTEALEATGFSDLENTIKEELADEGAISQSENLSTNNKELQLLFNAIGDGNLELVKYILEKGLSVNAEADNGWTALLEAIDEYENEIARYLIEQGANIKHQTKNGWTPLHECIDEGNAEMAQLLIDKGVNVNAATDNGMTPLMDAADEGDFEIFKLLINNGADINKTYHHGYTLLMEAVDESQMEMVSYLLEKGANPNQATDSGWTPLMESVDEGNIEIMNLLIENGANIDLSPDKNWNIFLEAIDENQVEIVDILITKGADANGRYGSTTPLIEAIDEGNLEMVKLLVEKGADVNKQSASGWTPLMEATDESQNEIIQYLIQSGANVNPKTESGWTPLMEAADEGNLEVMNLLLENGAKMDLSAENDWNIFLEAIDEKQIEMVEVLIEKGADVNGQYGHTTPLIEATDESDLSMIKFLVSKGADVNGQSESGWTPLMEAIDEKSLRVIEYLIDQGADFKKTNESGWNTLMEAADESDLNIAKLLINKGLSVNSKTKNGWTPLFEAIDEGNDEMAEYFISIGADINAMAKINNDVTITNIDNNLRFTDDQGNRFVITQGTKYSIGPAGEWTPIFEAVDENEIKIIKMLLDKGVDINQTVDMYQIMEGGEREVWDGYTPLMEAVRSDNLDMAEFLIKNKANANAKLGNGKSVLDFAKATKNVQMIRFIEANMAQ